MTEPPNVHQFVDDNYLGANEIEGVRLFCWEPPGEPVPDRETVVFVWGYDPESQTDENRMRPSYVRDALTGGFSVHKLMQTYLERLMPDPAARAAYVESANLLKRLLEAGYAVVALLPVETRESVLVNATYVRSMLRLMLGDRLPPFVQHPTGKRTRPPTAAPKALHVIGISMGGLSAKHALQSMRGETDRLRSYFSYDTPHRGANVPLSVQYYLDYWKHRTPEYNMFAKIHRYWNDINSSAAREAAFYHYTPGWEDKHRPVRDPRRTAMLEAFAALAQDNPMLAHIPNRYAIANGSGGQRFSAGELLGKVEIPPKLPLVNSYFWAIGSKHYCGSFRGRYEGDIRLNVLEKWDAYIGEAEPIDGMSGGLKDFIHDITGAHGSLGWRDETKIMCFIPHASAVDQQVGGFHCPLEDRARILWHDTCAMEDSTPHVSLHPRLTDFILAKLRQAGA